MKLEKPVEDVKELAHQYFNEAYDQQMKGELGEAVLLYKKSLELYPTAEAYTFLGWTYSFMKRFDDAITECRKAIEVDPDFGNPYNDIGAYLIEKGKLDEAIPWLEKAVQAKRYDSTCYPHFNLGRIWEIKGEWMKALGEYEKSLGQNLHYALAQKAIAKIRSLMN